MIIKRLRYKLLVAFLSIFFISIVALLGSLYIYSKKDTVTRNIRNVDDVRVLAFKNFKLVDDFMTYEVENEQYFKTEISKVKKEIEANYYEIMARLERNKKLLDADEPVLTAIISSIISAQEEYLARFSSLEQLILKKGFKDYGAEGRMRLYAHQLMLVNNPVIKTNALMLRRHEKDFIIRKDIEYLNKYMQVSTELEEYIGKAPGSHEEKIYLYNILLNYRKYFKDYCNIQYEIGVNENEGALFRLNEKYREIDALFDKEKAMSVHAEAQYTATLKYYNMVLISISVILSLVFSFFYSWQISNRAVRLKNSIEAYINSGFKKQAVIDKEIKISELEVIAQGFNKMAHEIDTYINFFKQKVEERTAEITRQKEKINRQRLLLSEKNRNLTDSILYAERIQKAILPPLAHFRNEFKDSFVFYRPRDIVSGDFYWMQSLSIEKKKRPVSVIEGEKEEEDVCLRNELFSAEPAGKKVLFAIADCTGHGVPGAFMSIVGHNHLDKIVNEYGMSTPSQVLNELNTGILSTLRQDVQDLATIKDGMDIALCSYDTEKRILKFAGANKSLYLVRNRHLYEFKGNKKPIGVSDVSIREIKFVDSEIRVQDGDTIYLFTDGYQDQFGGEKNKKFKTRKLKELLVRISDLDMDQQEGHMQSNFEAWKGKNFQVDDVLVMGIKF